MTLIKPEALEQLITRAFVANGMSYANAAVVAAVVAAAERDGGRSHGLLRMPGYVATLRSGWVDGKAKPIIRDAAPGVVSIDACNGFAQPALAAGRPLLISKARTAGIALMAIRNSHHFAALWPDVEGFAEEGLVALAFLHSRSRIVPTGGNRKLFGTNPMAFACPWDRGPPVVWDQASSVMANGDILIAAREGRPLPEGIGLDPDGKPTTDPNMVIKSNAQLPFGGHKGSMIALMVEILSAALTGARFGFEDGSAAFPGAQTSNAGQTIIVIDPKRSAGDGFPQRAGQLFALLAENGEARLPGSRRYAARARSLAVGIEVADDMYQSLVALAGEA